MTLYLGSDCEGYFVGDHRTTLRLHITSTTTAATNTCTAQTFSAKTKDRAGNESAAATLAVTIKAASCIDKPSSSEISLHSGDDSGVSNSDRHTNDTTLRFDISGSETAGIATLVDGGTEKTGTAVALSSGAGTTVAYTISEASNTSNTTINDYKLRIYDNAGNSSDTATTDVGNIYL